MALSMGLLGASVTLPPLSQDFDLLETQVLGSTATSVTFSSLSTYAADYQHLQIRISAKSTRTGGSAEMYGTANGLTQYWNHWLVGTGSAVGSQNFSYSKMFFCNIVSSDTSNDFNAAVVDLLDPFNTSKNKTVRTLSGISSTQKQVRLTSSIIPTTAALTTFSFQIEPSSSFVIGSRFSLYGIKAGA